MTRLRTVLRFARDQMGAISVEFALVFPVALLVYLGTAEFADSAKTSRKLDTLTYTVANVLSQEPTTDQPLSTPLPTTALTAQNLSDLVTGAQVILYPKPTNTLAITMSAVDITNNSGSGVCCSALVRWSYTSNGTLRPCNTQLTGTTANTLSTTQIPSTLLPTGTTLSHSVPYVIVDVSYTNPQLAGFLPISVNMYRFQFGRPRGSGQVIVGALPSSGSQKGAVCY